MSSSFEKDMFSWAILSFFLHEMAKDTYLVLTAKYVVDMFFVKKLFKTLLRNESKKWLKN